MEVYVKVIQIFGKMKCFETKKAERYFNERGIKVQLINIIEKGFSKRELRSVVQGVGAIETLVDSKCKDKDLLAIYQYLVEEDKEDKLLEYPILFQTPIVRNGAMATVGYQPNIWKTWN